ncbi:tRNA preQ1(34) S-adenosylmethionine ribosyltransferase-isomerase QueA [Pannus brasiliensis CCIBt3594]|uniref:S-adenosylmethionine:tRNA ribosyltransferase-isomerase n=1 Tax=Pannus brasiliensis CCIBt3594 TaxID=1427578 RepID=A0AAW9QYZ3_9CHRO
MTLDRLLSSYDYHLPPERIAQNPVTPRDSSRLLVVDSPDSRHFATFRDLPNWLQPGDLLILNDTKVIPARLYGRKTTGAPVEILLLEERPDRSWLSLVKPGKRFKIGSEIAFFPKSGQTEDESALWKARVIDRDLATGGRAIEFYTPENRSFWEMLAEYGHMPLPPYVTDSTAVDESYQTVYADKLGSVAAPTAGLHFTPEVFRDLTEKGIETAYITLHVGVGTFRPVETETITDHVMHKEYFEISPETIRKIAETKARGGRVIAVGTTVTRALEGAMKETEKEELTPFQGKTDLFVYPGYEWRVIDGMITNFHLPKSSLMMLVSAFIGRERLLDLYREAIEENFRFYSFGDAMLILPSAKI